MRRTAFGTILAGIILIGVGDTVAQQDPNDQGEPDSLMIAVTGPTAATADSSVTVELYFDIDQPLKSVMLYMFWENPILHYDSVRIAPAARAAFTIPPIFDPPHPDSINIYKHLYFVGLSTPFALMPAAQPQLVATYYLHLTSWHEDDIVCLDLSHHDDTWFVDIDGNEFHPNWRGEICLDLSAVPTGVDDLTDNNLPTICTLKQNYPNPFNPTTSIEYSLSVATRVRLVVINMLGQEVATLVDGVRSSGTYFAEWNGCDAAGNRVASGLYLYRLQAGETVQTRKMLLLK